jgi:DNA modification methylase
MNIETTVAFSGQLHNVQVDWLSVTELRPYKGNPRTHSKKQIRQIAGSIKAFGFTNPILIDSDGILLAGHGRLEAAKLLGWRNVPCIRLDHLNAAQRRAYVLADNKLAELAGWDEELMAIEFKGVIEIDPSFDLSVTGFAPQEIDAIIDGTEPQESADPREEMIPATAGSPISRIGDVWLLGPHRLLCGDATNEKCFQKLMGEERAQMVFTDPPYNLKIADITGLGATQHREFLQASGEMDPYQFAEFLVMSLYNHAKFSSDGAVHFVCMDWRHISQLWTAGQLVYGDLKQLCVWVKDNGGMGTFYRSQHELIFTWKVGNAPHLNNFELGQHGRYRTNVWHYKGVNSFGANRNDLALHPTVKPVQMIADAIKDVSERNGIVLDAFGGSGSTLIAAHKTGRRARLIELDPLYVDTIIRRYQTYAHDEATLAATGQSFAEVAAQRKIGAGDTQRECGPVRGVADQRKAEGAPNGESRP